MDNEIIFRGRKITTTDIETISTLIQSNPGMRRTPLSKELCRIWNWRQPNGYLKDMICRSLLVKLDTLKLIKLPPSRKRHNNYSGNPTKIYEMPIDQTPIVGNISELLPIQLKPIRRTPAEKLCNYLISKYHYLGYTRPVGEHVKYIAYSKDGRELAVLIYSSAPWYIGVRDKYIGWSPDIRIKNLHLITNNTRYLIMPWINVYNLASHILALSRNVICDDYKKLYNHDVYLVETFVDEEKYKGTCYIADNWINVGTTTGRGKLSKSIIPTLPKKKVFVYPLCKNFRKKLNE